MGVLKFDHSPTTFGNPGALYPPASPVPCPQARKGGRQIEKTHNTEGLGSENISMFFSNSIVNRKGFLPRPALFRAWTGGSTAGATNPAGLPAVTGEASWTRGAGGEPATTNSAGAFRVTLAGSTTTNAVSGAGDVRLDFDASWSNPIYGASPTVMPASVDLPVCLYLGLRA